MAEYNASGTLLNRYIHGAGTDDPLVWYTGTGTSNKRYLLADERGSIVSETNATGGVVTTHRYGPYGEPINQSVSHFRYTGQILIPGTELYHYKARVYHPKLGRFLQTDPIGYQDGMNWYAYGGNDPVNRVDSTGKASERIRAIRFRQAAKALLPKDSKIVKALDKAELTDKAEANALFGDKAAGAAAVKALRESSSDGVGKLKNRSPAPTIDKSTRTEVGRFVVDSKGNVLIEPVGGKTVSAGKGGVDTHTLYPNGSNYHRLNPQGHGNNPTPHGHGHLEGTGPYMRGQGPSIDTIGNEVPWNSPAAHWPIN